MLDFAQIDAECIRCGLCLRQQKAEGMPELACGTLAKELAAANSVATLPPQTLEFIRSCSLCDACTAHCPVFISCGQLVKAARERLLALQPELAQAYTSFRVDCPNNIFTNLRKAAGIYYDDALDVGEDTPAGSVALFLPGCALASYSQPLTLATYELLLNCGVVQGLSVHCCGNPLRNSGFGQEYASYTAGFMASLAKHHVSKIITACPNCYYSLQSLLQKNAMQVEVDLQSLPQVLVDSGVYYEATSLLSVNLSRAASLSSCGDLPGKLQNPDLTSIAIHDSCPDRYEQRFGQATRALFEPNGPDILEMPNRGLETICCGAGGLSQVGNPDLSAERCRLRFEQFAKTKADCLVCSCVSCVNAFSAHAGARPVRHYLELLTGVSIDWQAVAMAYDKVYAA